MEINKEAILKRLKVVKRSTLFPLEPDFKQLEDKRCPLCNRKYKVMRSGDIYCNKHQPAFFMKGKPTYQKL